MPLFKCSATNLCISSLSLRLSGINLAGRVAGASGSSSMAWSHIVCPGSRWDCSSLNTFLCHSYSSGSWWFGGVSGLVGWMVTLLMSYWLGRGGRGEFLLLGAKIAFFALSAHRMMGNWVWSIHPRFQSILGWTAANHG